METRNLPRTAFAALPTVLLHHTSAVGGHFDWLIELPHLPPAAGTAGSRSMGDRSCDPERTGQAGLWTARLTVPSHHWAAAGRFDLVVIHPHRRAYLDYQGPISGGRGRVRQVDRGGARLIHRSHARIVMELTMARFRGRVDLRHLAGDRWRAKVGG